MSGISATVKVRMEVEVTIGNWDSKQSFDRLREMAMREARQVIESAFYKKSGCRIIGEPKSMHVILEEETKP